MRKEQIGDCTLYLADCSEIVPGLEVDHVITDPPDMFIEKPEQADML